jgi:hypothetical protein
VIPFPLAFIPQADWSDAVDALKLRPCPKWLGDFRFAYWSLNGVNALPFPKALLPLVVRLDALVPAQVFDTVFVQKYEQGESVKPHRDPKSNTGHTVVGIFGEFEGATVAVESVPEDRAYTVRPGDAYVLPCTINGVQGPRHRVTPVTYGVRYALILNTMET